MKYALSITTFLLICSLTARGQQFNDTIVTSNNDTITCLITLINDVNVFYSYPVKKREQHSYIPLQEVKSYAWNSKNVKQIQEDTIYSLQNSTKKFGVRVRITSAYSHRIISNQYFTSGMYSSPQLSVYYKSNSLSVGPYVVSIVYSLFPALQNHYVGIQLGYRYDFDPLNEKTNVFLFYNFNFAKIEHWSSSMAGSKIEIDEHSSFENSVGIGFNHKINSKWGAFAGFGPGVRDKLAVDGGFVVMGFFGASYRLK